jgi:hypothetical protein
LLYNQHTPPLALTATKWNVIFPPDFKFQWAEVWDTERARKEATLLWQLWHRAIVVNVWCTKISIAIDTTCPMCDLEAAETVLHRFWTCPCSQQTWAYTNELLKMFVSTAHQQVWAVLDWKHAMFVANPTRKFKHVNWLWLLLRGVTIWCVLIARNHFVFSHERWNHHHVTTMIWKGLYE